jgi:hypothetical protein
MARRRVTEMDVKLLSSIYLGDVSARRGPLSIAKFRANGINGLEVRSKRPFRQALSIYYDRAE